MKTYRKIEVLEGYFKTYVTIYDDLECAHRYRFANSNDNLKRISRLSRNQDFFRTTLDFSETGHMIYIERMWP